MAWWATQVITQVPGDSVGWLVSQGLQITAETYDATTVPPTPYYAMTRQTLQNWEILQSLLDEYTIAYNNARDANTIRYNEVIVDWTEMLSSSQMQFDEQNDEQNTHVALYQLSWRWVFYVNLIPGLLAEGFVGFAWRDQIHSQTKPAVDYAGAGLLMSAVVTVLLGLMDSGTSTGLLLIAASIILLVLLLWVESRAADPILPLHLFRERLFAVTIAHGTLTGWAMFGSISFVPLFVQSVLGTTATRAGITIAPMLLGWVLSSIVGTRLLLRVGYRNLVMTGTIALMTGAFFMSRIGVETSQTSLMIFVALMGIGMGLSIPPFLIAVQTTQWKP